MTSERQEADSGALYGAQYDFSRAELTKFLRDHQEARVSAFSVCWPKEAKVKDIGTSMEACLGHAVAGTILGIRTVPRRKEYPEMVTYYVGGEDGSLYACTREFSRLQPFQKSSAVHLSRKNEEAQLTDLYSGLGVLVAVNELLKYEVPGH